MKNAKITKTEDTKTKESRSQNSVRLTESLKAVAIAFLVGLVLIILTGQAKEILNFIISFITITFGNKYNFANFLGKLAYMIPIGLSLVVSFRMGLFNIGAAGQAIGGGLAAYLFAINIDVGGSGFIFTLIIGTLVGMSIAMLIAWLKNQFKINEVMSSIMINWIFFFILRYFSPGAADSSVILEGNGLRQGWLSGLFGTETNFNSINIGIIISIILIPVLAFAYKKTLWGYKQELMGNNANIGKYIGIKKNKEVMKTMMISGGFAGLSGTIYFTGFIGNLPPNSIVDIPSWAFNGITIALIGFNNPIGVLFSSILIGMLTSPSNDLDLVIGGLQIVNIMVAIMVIFIARSHYRIYHGKIQNPQYKVYYEKMKSKFKKGAED